MRGVVFAASVGLSVLACGGAPTGDPTARPASPGPFAQASSDARDAPLPTGPESVPFVHDDYAGALAAAKRTGRPLFVDAWAPWCHSCQSMRAYVLTDPSLAPLARDFVWLSIDTEREDNAAFVSRFPSRVWPTLWVIDPAREVPVLRWEGTATAPELIALLATVKSGARAGAGEAAVAFLRASQAAARGDAAEAERGYRVVLALREAPERARAAEALVGLLASRKDQAACAELALAEAPAMAPGTSRAAVLATGLGCARESNQEAALANLGDLAERVAADADPRTMADDRSALFEELVETRKKQNNEAGARATARAWASFLEREAARATTKEGRAVFDPHRLSAYLAAGEPERALPMLNESERDFPTDYNPPARLARAYLEMHRLREAKDAVGRAATRVYGPRTLRVYALAADIAHASGDKAGEQAALEQATARTARLVLTEGQKKLRSDLEKRLRALPP